MLLDHAADPVDGAFPLHAELVEVDDGPVHLVPLLRHQIPAHTPFSGDDGMGFQKLLDGVGIVVAEYGRIDGEVDRDIVWPLEADHPEHIFTLCHNESSRFGFQFFMDPRPKRKSGSGRFRFPSRSVLPCRKSQRIASPKIASPSGLSAKSWPRPGYSRYTNSAPSRSSAAASLLLCSTEITGSAPPWRMHRGVYFRTDASAGSDTPHPARPAA